MGGRGVQAASDVVSEVERAVEQYSKGVGHLTQKLPLPGGAFHSMQCFLRGACLYDATGPMAAHTHAFSALWHRGYWTVSGGSQLM